MTGFTITIGENQASGTGTFRLTPTDDSTDEPDETVAITGSALGSLTVTAATLKIEDNDDEPTVTLSLSDTSISEAGGIATVTASLGHTSSEATEVTVSVTPDSPALVSDFTLRANTALRIAAGATLSTGTVTITGVNNDVDAANKTVTVKGLAENDVGSDRPLGCDADPGGR